MLLNNPMPFFSNFDNINIQVLEELEFFFVSHVKKKFMLKIVSHVKNCESC